MRFLDRFNPKQEKMQAAQDTTAIDNAGARFTLLVEETFSLRQNRGVVVAGTVHGTVCKGDTVYLLSPNAAPISSTVVGLELGHDCVQSATHQPIAIWLESIKDKQQAPQYSVLTSIQPQPQPDVNTAVENPALLGLSMEYERFQADSTYGKLLLDEIAQAKFLVAVHMDGHEALPQTKNSIPSSTEAADESAANAVILAKATTLRFPSITDPAHKDAQYFPLFTDWSALALWDTVFDAQHPPKTMIVSLAACAALAGKDSASLVVNPFGPVNIALPMDVVASIIKATGA